MWNLRDFYLFTPGGVVPASETAASIHAAVAYWALAGVDGITLAASAVLRGAVGRRLAMSVQVGNVVIGVAVIAGDLAGQVVINAALSGGIIIAILAAIIFVLLWLLQPSSARLAARRPRRFSTPS